MTWRRCTGVVLVFLAFMLNGCAGQQSLVEDSSETGIDYGYVLLRIGTGVPPGEDMPEAYSEGIFQWSAIVIRNVATGETHRIWRDERSWLDPNLMALPPGQYYLDRVRTLVWGSNDGKVLTRPTASFEIRSGCVTYIGEWRLVALIDRPFMKPVVRMDTATVESARRLYPEVFASNPEIIIVNPVEFGSAI